ncbi:MAG: hypothetical protein FJZ01_25445 [Candidatus Sericytochromatia bacterium]|nr:hypothetical protein [Candidatus Tanganyikabacteria bacterium]
MAANRRTSPGWIAPLAALLMALPCSGCLSTTYFRENPSLGYEVVATGDIKVTYTCYQGLNVLSFLSGFLQDVFFFGILPTALFGAISWRGPSRATVSDIFYAGLPLGIITFSQAVFDGTVFVVGILNRSKVAGDWQVQVHRGAWNHGNGTFSVGDSGRATALLSTSPIPDDLPLTFQVVDASGAVQFVEITNLRFSELRARYGAGR